MIISNRVCICQLCAVDQRPLVVSGMRDKKR